MVGRTIGYIIREYTTLIIEDYTKRDNDPGIIIYQQLDLKLLFLENSYYKFYRNRFKIIRSKNHSKNPLCPDPPHHSHPHLKPSQIEVLTTKDNKLQSIFKI